MKQNKFNSLHEFSQFIANNNPCGYFENYPANLLQSTLQDRDIKEYKPGGKRKIVIGKFYNSNSYNDANRLMSDGWKEGAERVQKFMTESIQATAAKSQTYRAPVGFAPCVPAYIQGHPCNMYKKKRARVSARVVIICYNCSVGCKTPAHDIERAAARLFNVITGLESSGVHVELWAVSIADDHADNYYNLAVKVKDAAQPFNLLKMCYPIMHPSFNRRHKFAWLERSGVPGSWLGYGSTTIDQNKALELVRKIGINTNCLLSFYDIDGKDETEIAKMIK